MCKRARHFLEFCTTKVHFFCVCANYFVPLWPQKLIGVMKRFIFTALIAFGMLVSSTAATVQERVIHYPSVDQNGQALTLSGKLSVPEQPKGIILWPHFTIGSNEEAPSNRLTADAKCLKDDYVLIMPDYIGFGVSVDRVHPYLHGELTARNTVDLLLYTQPILDSMALGLPTDSIYIVGYSQGGATALWTLKLIEEEYADRIHVKRCFVGSAPCDVASTYDEAVLHSHVSVPALISMLVVGTSEAYGLHLNLEKILTPAAISKYNKYIAKKDHRLASAYFGMPNHKLNHWLTAEGMDRTQPETKRMYEGLLRSSLLHNSITGDATENFCPSWTPKTPMYVFHSTTDELVSFSNAEHLQQCFRDVKSITWDFGRYGGHIGATRCFVPNVKKILAGE